MEMQRLPCHWAHKFRWRQRLVEQSESGHKVPLPSQCSDSRSPDGFRSSSGACCRGGTSRLSLEIHETTKRTFFGGETQGIRFAPTRIGIGHGPSRFFWPFGPTAPFWAKNSGIPIRRGVGSVRNMSMALHFELPGFPRFSQLLRTILFFLPGHSGANPGAKTTNALLSWRICLKL